MPQKRKCQRVDSELISITFSRGEVAHFRAVVPNGKRSAAIRAALRQAGLLPIEEPQNKTPTAA